MGAATETMKLGHVFAVFSTTVAEWAGKPVTFCVAFVLILLWAVSGPFFQYSETWQLVVNTATTIVTFLMVFVLQNSQNRDSKALQTKLDELILTSKAQNKFVGVENLDEGELRKISKALHKQAEGIEAKAEARRSKKKDRDVAAKPSQPPRPNKSASPEKTAVSATQAAQLPRKGKP
jgi:low affinity Fe/Cu permease